MSWRRPKSVAVVAALAGGTFLVTGSAAFADPVEPYRLQLRLVVDCHAKAEDGDGAGRWAAQGAAHEQAVRP